LDQATRLLEQAVQLKPDYANAYFNLADIAKEVKKEPQQLAYLDKTLTLIKQDDPQYEKIKVEADALRKKLGDAASAAAAEQSATPSATPKPTATPRPQTIEATESATPRVTTPVNLSEDAGIASASAIPEVPQE
jgi:tetratricopeptide (TPR) repeat protein